jgi:hypothetical protein
MFTQSIKRVDALADAPCRYWSPSNDRRRSQKAAAVLAAIAKLPKDATFEDFNRQRLTIIIPEKQKLN